MRLTMLNAVSAAALLIGLSPAIAQEVLRVPYSADISSFDPDNSFEVLGLSAINNVYEGLVEYAPGTIELRGLLATDWSVSEDGLTYTFNLVEGATFHDGTPVDAAAVKTAFERRRDGELVLSYFLWNVKDIAAPDPRTVVITLGQPQPSFLDTLASPWGPKVISPTALAEHAGEDNAASWLNENAVGSGPFRLARFERGQEYVLERFDSYHGEQPYFASVELPIVPDIGQQILQLRSQEIDAVPNNYPWAQLSALPPGLEITAAPSMALLTAYVNPTSPLSDPAVRGAVLTAINPALWVEDAYGPYATPALSLFQAVMLQPQTPVAFPADMDAAKAAITAAGSITLTIGYATEETPNVARAADLMVAQLAEIGVSATIEVMPSGAIFNMQGDLEGAPDLVLARQSPDAAHPETQASVFYATGAPLNLMGVSVPEADALITQAGATTDIAERNRLYEEAGRLIFEAGHFVPLVDVQDVVVHAEGLTDLGLRPVFPPGNIDFGTVRWAE
jgi:peptide/nickel transport system substrate-binding protein